MKIFYFISALFLSISCYAESISLDRIQMNVVKTDACGVVNHQTIFHFAQKNESVEAYYTGGKILKGFLIGRFVKENQLIFSYCQMQTDGTIDHGQSECVVSKDGDGKVVLTEHFEWASRPGECGINIFKEL